MWPACGTCATSGSLCVGHRDQEGGRQNSSRYGRKEKAGQQIRHGKGIREAFPKHLAPTTVKDAVFILTMLQGFRL